MRLRDALGLGHINPFNRKSDDGCADAIQSHPRPRRPYRQTRLGRRGRLQYKGPYPAKCRIRVSFRRQKMLRELATDTPWTWQQREQPYQKEFLHGHLTYELDDIPRNWRGYNCRTDRPESPMLAEVPGDMLTSDLRYFSDLPARP